MPRQQQARAQASHAASPEASQRLRLGIPPIFWPTLALLALYAAIYAQFALRLIAFPFDLDQGETYDAWSGWLINLGQLPYSDNATFPYYSHGYPPVWSYLVSVPMAWLGMGLGPARAVSALVAVLAAGAVGLAARRQTGQLLTAALAAGFFLASPYVFHTTPLARVNGAALFFAVCGLLLLDVPSPRRVVLGSVLLVVALFTKPTVVDAVAAGLLFLLLVRPRQAVLSGLLIALGSGTVLASLQVASHGTYVVNVLAGNSSPFELGQLIDYVGNFIGLHLVLVVLAAAELVGAVHKRAWTPWLAYAVAGLVWAVATIGKTGAGESYFLAPIAAISVLAAVGVQRLAHRPVWGPILAVALPAQLLVLAHGPLSDLVPWLPDRGPQAAFLGREPSSADEAVGEALVALIRRAPGPVLAEDASFVVVAGKSLVGATPPSLRNLYHAGLWDPTPMVDDLRARRYAIVVLNAELYPEPVLAAIGQFYFQDRSLRMNGSTYRVFRPGST